MIFHTYFQVFPHVSTCFGVSNSVGGSSIAAVTPRCPFSQPSIKSLFGSAADGIRWNSVHVRAGGHQTSENWTTPWVPPRLNGDLMESMVIWGFLKMGDRQFTKGFNTKTWWLGWFLGPQLGNIYICGVVFELHLSMHKSLKHQDDRGLPALGKMIVVEEVNAL